jgi:hypothetical protein
MRTTAIRAARTARRVKRVWAELDYAQRRLLEIRTGVPFTSGENRPRSRDPGEARDRMM